MSEGALRLAEAIRTRLAADAALATLLGGARIHEGTFRGSLMPYVSLDEITTRDRGGVEADLAEHRLTIRVWSKTGTRAEALSVAARLTTLLDGAALTLAGHRLVALALEGQDLRYGKDRIGVEVALRFRAVTERV
jgi:hypothetical protein